jgi:aerobic-type carbon monoxide dehydrogenase small subunit (CoxS/CutS family)
MIGTYELTVNGKKSSITTHSGRPLLDVLREDLHLTGSKFGCGEGKCGACTVLADGKRTFSCSTSIEEADKKTIVTIEGLAEGEKLHPVQEAFLAEDAFQCGYCTSGMIMGAVALLNEKPKPTDGEILTFMNKQICRCCTYPRIFKAVHRAAGLAVVEAKP